MNNCCPYSKYCLIRLSLEALEIMPGNFFDEVDKHFFNQTFHSSIIPFGFHLVRIMLPPFIDFMKLLYTTFKKCENIGSHP